MTVIKSMKSTDSQLITKRESELLERSFSAAVAALISILLLQTPSEARSHLTVSSNHCRIISRSLVVVVSIICIPDAVAINTLILYIFFH